MTAQETPPTDVQVGVDQFHATVRRAPKVGVFLILGGFVGAVVALILTVTHPDGEQGLNDDLGVWIMVVFFFAITVGVGLGGLLALVLDRLSRRRVSHVTVERGFVDEAGNEGPAAAPEAGTDDGAVAEGDEAQPTAGPAAGEAAASEVAENSSPDVGGRA